MIELGQLGLAPRVMLTKTMKSHLVLQGYFVTVTEAIPSGYLFKPGAAEWERYGALIKTFHVAADVILAGADAKWAGRARQRFNADFLIVEPLTQIEAAPFLSIDIIRSYASVAGRLSDICQDALSDCARFIHFDPHLGNVLTTEDRWYLVDFEESGFGPRSLDLGVMRLHAICNDQLTTAWPAFSRGYGLSNEERGAIIGCLLKTFHLAGKILQRLDLPHIKRDPARIMQRYLGVIHGELDRLGTCS